MSDSVTDSKEDKIEQLRKRLGKLVPRPIAAWRAMTPARRLEIAFQACQFALEVVRTTEHWDHPDLSPVELAWQVTRRMQGDRNLGTDDRSMTEAEVEIPK